MDELAWGSLSCYVAELSQAAGWPSPDAVNTSPKTSVSCDGRECQLQTPHACDPRMVRGFQSRRPYASGPASREVRPDHSWIPRKEVHLTRYHWIPYPDITRWNPALHLLR